MKINMTRTLAVLSVITVLGVLGQALGSAGQAGDPGVMLRTAIEKEEVDGDLPGAIELYKQIVAKFGVNRAIAAKALVRLGGCYQKLGEEQSSLAQKTFEKVVADYPDQTEAVNLAREKLAAVLRARAAAKMAPPEFRLRQVWAGEGVDTEGSVTLDGRYLSFVDWDTGDLAVRDLVTGTNRRLTNKGTWEQSPDEMAGASKWSRDGGRIAYQWYDNEGVEELRVLDLKDSSIRTIHRDETEDWVEPFDWTPDGRYVLAALFAGATSTQGRKTRVGLVSVEDGSVKWLNGRFENLIDYASRFSLSPEGKFMAYDAPPDSGGTGGHDIFLLALDDQTETPLVQHPENDMVVAWVPDGRGLLFTSDRTGSPDLYLLPMSDGKPQEGPRLIKSGLSGGPLGMTSRGELYLGSSGSANDIYAIDVDLERWKARAPVKKLALPNQGRVREAVYSPDGQRMAFRSYRMGGRQQALSILDEKTGQIRELASPPTGAGPGLLPDSMMFLHWIPPDYQDLSTSGRDKEGRIGLYRIDAQTGEVVPLIQFERGQGSQTQAWSADGKRIFYTAGGGPEGKRYIYSYDLETRKNKRLSGSPDDARFIAMSPDGEWLAVVNADGRRTIKIMPSSGGEPREIYRFPFESGTVIGPAWSPDGRFVYFPWPRDPQTNFADLYRVSRDGGRAERIDLGMLFIRCLTVHPDGQRIAFSSPGDKFPQGQVWVMENFLPPPARPEKADQEFSMRRVYDGTGLEWGNALSSDGRYLVYTDWTSGDLAVMDLVTKKSRSLTKGGGLSTGTGEMGETSAFSPDDKRIAYGWINKDKVPELWVVDFDGSGPRLLWRDGSSGRIRPHDWSPDGRQVLAINMKKEGPSEIALVSAADGTVRVLREASEQDPELDMSPDGRFVACSMAAGPTSPERDIGIIKTADGDLNPLVTHAADDYALGWAPDGRTLLFASNRTGAYGIWGVRVSGGRAQDPPFAIKPVFNYAEPVRLAPDGSFYYILNETTIDIFTAGVDPATGKILGRPKAVPTRYSGANLGAEWSPDGTRLAYLTSPGGLPGPSWPAVISILDTRTGEERQVKAKIEAIVPSHLFVDWAPDGRSFLVIGKTGEQMAIYRIDALTGASEPLVTIPKFEYSMHAAWSADGRSIFYPRGNPTRILRRDLDTGRDVELVSIPGPPGMPAVSVSPDGKWLAFTTKPEGENKVGIKIVPPAGGEVRELLQTADGGLITDLNWTPDGRYLWFRKATPSDDPEAGSKFESWRVSPDGGDPQRLELDVSGGGVRLHPDGRQIVYYSGRGRRDLWVMKNFLPADQAKK